MEFTVKTHNRLHPSSNSELETDELVNWLVEFEHVEHVEPYVDTESDRLWKLHAGNLKREHANEIMTLKEAHEFAIEELKVELRDLDIKLKNSEVNRLGGRRKLRTEIKRAEKAENALKEAQAQLKSLKAQIDSYDNNHEVQIRRFQSRIDNLKSEREELKYQLLSQETLERRHMNFVHALQDDGLHPSTTGEVSKHNSTEFDRCHSCAQRAASMQMTQRYNATLLNTIGTLKNEMLLAKGRLGSIMSELEDTNSVDKVEKGQIIEVRRHQIEELKAEKASLMIELEDLGTRTAAEKAKSTKDIEGLTASLKLAEQDSELLQKRVCVLQKADEAFGIFKQRNLIEDNLLKAMDEIYDAKIADNELLAKAVNVFEEKLKNALSDNLVLKYRVQELTVESSIRNEQIMKLETSKNGLDIEVGRLEFALDEKTRDLEAKIAAFSSEKSKLEEFCHTLRTIKPNEGTTLNRWYLEQKESENTAMKNEIIDLRGELNNLQQILWQRASSDAQYMGCAAVLEEDNAEMKSRLNNAIGMIRGLGGPPELYEPLKVRTS